ncbi:MAG: hypothetical protein A2049_10915 [Elusimicrobia bacterium GWA2_62_23]|nr:MAG: hypothetical protein A2049_10915 [Elusimicrobia bacterium GWA2_62_23]OGR68232.1 MAG: hypothetical protein A2179_02660 [Elusimicrobia bacterium GWC2_63_65]
MNKNFALSAVLVFATGLGLAFAGVQEPALPGTPAAEVKQEDPKAREFKDILFKLVRQDEYLDEALETIDASNGRMSAHDLSAMGLSLKMISNNLRYVASRNKAEFHAVQPGSPNARYINTIFSYSRKVNRKAGRVGALVALMAAKNKKRAAMRDAVSSRKGGKKVKGKKIAQILEEQKAMDALAADARELRAASRGLNATSKWLYIAAK